MTILPLLLSDTFVICGAHNRLHFTVLVAAQLPELVFISD